MRVCYIITHMSNRVTGFRVIACRWPEVLHWLAQDVPSGWKVVTDRQKTCQLAVPGADRVADKLVSSFVQSPDHKSSVVAHGVRSEQPFADAVLKWRADDETDQELRGHEQASLRRHIEGNSGTGTNWDVAVAGKPICAAQITFKDAAAGAMSQENRSEPDSGEASGAIAREIEPQRIHRLAGDRHHSGAGGGPGGKDD